MELARAANKLTASWARALKVDGSVVFSGAGIWPLIAILASAAEGRARDELCAAAGVESADGLTSALQVIESIGRGDSHLALGFWTNAHLPLAEWWTGNVPAQVRGLLTGRKAIDQAQLDSWASEHTGGQIQSIGVELQEAERWQDSTLLVAASALSIETLWKEPFEVGSMKAMAGPWANRRLLALWRSTSNLDDVAIAQDTAIGPLTLVVVQGAADMDVVLATAAEIHSPGEVLTTACEVLSDDVRLAHGSELGEGYAAPALSVARVESFEPTPQLRISVPPFMLATRQEVTEYPDVFGLGTLMDGSRGHLPNISEFPLALNHCVQQATASFSAKGFRAAAVTALEMRFGASGERFSNRCVTVDFDRPFAFLARHRPTGLLVLAGLVADARDFDWS